VTPYKRSIERLPMAAAAAVLALAVLAPGQARAQAKVTDKWITVILPGEPHDIEGCDGSRSVQGRVVKFNVVESLIQKNPADGVLKPRLATSWKQIDPLTWEFKLREGVTFHNGAPFDAASVKRSMDRTLGKTIVCQDRTKFFNGITVETIAVDPVTVHFKTPRPDAIMPMRLANTTIVGPNAPMDKQTLDTVGTGPYAFDSWTPGQQILLKRNDKWWGPKPQAEGVRYIWRTESAVRAAMVQIGEADIASTIAQQEATDPKMDFSYLNSETTMLRYDAMQPPMNDIRVRRAMNMAIDLNSIRGTLLPKDIIPATQVVMPSIPGHNHELDKRVKEYNPAKAKQLLAEAKAAGVPVDTEILFLASTYHYQNSLEVAEAVVNMYRAVGLKMKIQALEAGLYAKWTNKPYPDKAGPSILQASHDNNSGDPVFSAFQRFACDGASSNVCSPELDREIARVSDLGGDARVKGWQEIMRTIYEDLEPVLFMYHMVGFTRVGPRVDFKPDVTTNAEIRIEEIKFK